jgi:maltose alpha-D-glucosyltransferase/alpha-amylase
VIDDPGSHRWYRQAVIYCLDVDSFEDSNGDGHGDLQGLRSRLPHLARLGVTCLWLNPIHPTPHRDDGYDVADYYGVDPRLGTLGDFVELVHEAADSGIRVVIDLVVNHTSDQHPWFVSAKSSPDSPYRDWYVWSQDEPADRHQGMVFPGEQDETWSWCEEAGAWYYHRFYGFQPDLNWRNPEVKAEIQRVMGFWSQLGVAGFRVDAAPFVIELVEPGPEPDVNDFSIIDGWRRFLQWRRGDAVLLGEANVSPQDVPQYFGSSSESADRLHMLFDFVLNPRLFLALARRTAEPLAEALTDAVRVPRGGQWVTFLRNHDELDLSRLTDGQRAEVFEAFAPQEDMRLYGRGIRRRLAPMLGGDRQRIELAYALQFSLPGTPAIRYGEEIGMGEDLSLPGRDAFRTPMQWDGREGAGFSTADADQLVHPVVSEGEFGYRTTNVTAQRGDRDSLLTWMQGLVNVRRECPECGDGALTLVKGSGVPPEVLAHRVDSPDGSILFLHNLSARDQVVDVRATSGLDDAGDVQELFADGRGKALGQPLAEIDLPPYGYRWIRLLR